MHSLAATDPVDDTGFTPL
jgi:ankyrin repeat protein